MVTLDGSLIESSGAMTGGSKSRGNRPAFGGNAGGHSSIDKHERLVQDANLLYSTVDAALRETMLNLQDLRNRINNVDGSDHYRLTEKLEGRYGQSHQIPLRDRKEDEYLQSRVRNL